MVEKILEEVRGSETDCCKYFIFVLECISDKKNQNRVSCDTAEERKSLRNEALVH